MHAGTYEVVKPSIIMSGQSKPLWASDLHPVGLHYYTGVSSEKSEPPGGVVRAASNHRQKRRSSLDCFVFSGDVIGNKELLESLDVLRPLLVSGVELIDLS